MKDTKLWLQNVIVGIIVAAVGVYIFFQTDQPEKVMVIGIGAYITVTGIVSLFTSIRKQLDDLARNYMLIKGMLGLAIGVLSIALPLGNSDISGKFLIYLLGGTLVADVILILLSLNGLRKAGMQLGRFLTTLGISAILALIIFFMPGNSEKLVLSIVAAVIVIYGVVLIALGVTKRKKITQSKTPEAEPEIITPEPAAVKEKKRRGLKLGKKQKDAESAKQVPVEPAPETPGDDLPVVKSKEQPQEPSEAQQKKVPKAQPDPVEQPAKVEEPAEKTDTKPEKEKE